MDRSKLLPVLTAFFLLSISCASCQQWGTLPEPEKVGETLLRTKRSDKPGSDYYSISTTEGSLANFGSDAFDGEEIIEFNDTDGVHSYRKFKTLSLPFDFPFYGSPVKEVSVMLEGFLNIGDVCTWARDRRFLAPFKAKFKSSGATLGTVKYISNELFFAVLWSNLTLEIIPTTLSSTFSVVLAKFTFSAAIRPDGMIIFAYNSVPNLKEWYPLEGYFVGTSNSIPVIPGKCEGATYDDGVEQLSKYDLTDAGKVSNKSIINLIPKWPKRPKQPKPTTVADWVF